MRWFGFIAGVWGAVVWWLAVWKRGSGQRPPYTMYLPCFESSFPPQHPRRWHHNPRPRLSTAIDPKYLSGPAVTKADFPAVKIILSTTTFNSLQGEVQSFLIHPHPILPPANASHPQHLHGKRRRLCQPFYSHPPLNLAVVFNIRQFPSPRARTHLDSKYHKTRRRCNGQVQAKWPLLRPVMSGPAAELPTGLALSGMGVADGTLPWYRGWGWGCGVESLVLCVVVCGEVGGVLAMGSCAFRVMGLGRVECGIMSRKVRSRWEIGTSRGTGRAEGGRLKPP